MQSFLDQSAVFLQFLRKQPKAANLRNKKRLFIQPNS
jgi:hypothetical protein